MKKEFLSIILIVVLGFGIYANSLKGEFVWDDIDLVEKNDYIKDFSNTAKIFSRDIGAGSRTEFNFYRPVQMISYMLDYRLWGSNTFGFHLTNTILHILVALSLYFLLSLIFKDSLLALFSCVLYIVHPIHTEAVSYISGRADLLGALFIVLSFIFYIRFHALGKRSSYILMVLSFLCALLSKEAVLIFPLLLIGYHLSFTRKIDYRAFITVACLVCVYVVARFTLLKELKLDAVYFNNTLFQRLPGFFVALTDYARLLIAPFDLHMEYGFKTFSLGDPKALTGMFLAAVALATVVVKRKDRLISFSLAWFFITLLPHSGLYPVNAYMAEHWLYLPSLGFFLVIARLLAGWARTKRFKVLGIAGLIALLSFYSFLTVRQNAYWQDAVRFYSRILEYVPNSPRVHNNLGLAYIALEDTEKALASFKRAEELGPPHPDVYYNLGNAYRVLGQDRLALASFTKAVNLKPDYAQAYYDLGNTFADVRDVHQSMLAYEKAVAIDPSYIEAYNNLGNAYRALGRKEQAVEVFKKVISLSPRDSFAYNNLANSYANLGKIEEAISAVKKAIEYNPSHPDIYYNLGHIYMQAGRLPEAVAAFKKALEINPASGAYHYTLAVAYHQLKEYQLAIERLDKAVSLGYKANSNFIKALKAYRE